MNRLDFYALALQSQYSATQLLVGTLLRLDPHQRVDALQFAVVCRTFCLTTVGNTVEFGVERILLYLAYRVTNVSFLGFENLFNLLLGQRIHWIDKRVGCKRIHRE